MLNKGNRVAWLAGWNYGRNYVLTCQEKYADLSACQEDIATQLRAWAVFKGQVSDRGAGYVAALASAVGGC